MLWVFLRRISKDGEDDRSDSLDDREGTNDYDDDDDDEDEAGEEEDEAREDYNDDVDKRRHNKDNNLIPYRRISSLIGLFVNLITIIYNISLEVIRVKANRV